MPHWDEHQKLLGLHILLAFSNCPQCHWTYVSWEGNSHTRLAKSCKTQVISVALVETLFIIKTTMCKILWSLFCVQKTGPHSSVDLCPKCPTLLLQWWQWNEPHHRLTHRKTIHYTTVKFTNYFGYENRIREERLISSCRKKKNWKK